MTTTVNLRRILDRKQWEMCNFAPVSSGIATCIVSSNLTDQYQFMVTATTVAYMYDPAEDGWVLLPSPALAGTFAAGACGARHPWGPRATATAGTSTTITTNLNLQRNLAGYTVRIIAGPNAGVERVIASNTTGASSIITVTVAFSTPITSASEYILLTGRTWILGSGTLAAGSFRYYDLATNTWNTAAITGLPATITIDGKLVSTPGHLTDFVTATATSGTATTIVQSTATWAVNNWANYQVRITGGTGAGQFRSIVSNTATALTVATWTINPDATSTFVIEGNSDFMYFLGNNAVTMYRYSLSGNTWTTLSPGVARAAAPVAGMSANWVWGVTDANWTITTGTTAYLNGKYIYSFRGTTAVLDRYDIAANSWENDIAYSPKTDVFASGTSYSYTGNDIYAMLTTGRMVKYNVSKQALEPSSQLWFTQGAALLGDRLFDVTYTDGATVLRYMYYMSATQPYLFRTLLF